MLIFLVLLNRLDNKHAVAFRIYANRIIVRVGKSEPETVVLVNHTGREQAQLHREYAGIEGVALHVDLHAHVVDFEFEPRIWQHGFESGKRLASRNSNEFYGLALHRL
jgi:hypothetical protein